MCVVDRARTSTVQVWRRAPIIVSVVYTSIGVGGGSSAVSNMARDRTGSEWKSPSASPGLILASVAVGVVAGAGVAGLGAVLWLRRREMKTENGTNVCVLTVLLCCIDRSTFLACMLAGVQHAM